MIINLAKIRFGGSGGGTSPAKPEDFFQETYTANGNYDVTPQAGHVFSGGAITVNVQPRLQTKEATPLTLAQTVSPDAGYDGLQSVTVTGVTSEIDSNITADNIKKDVTILGVTGTLESGITPEGTITITANGTYDVSSKATADVQVGGTDYRYKTGTPDTIGLAAIGWDADSIGYYGANAPHYAWENDNYKVSQKNIDLYSLDNPDPDLYKDDPDVTFVPNKNMSTHFSGSLAFQDMKYIRSIPLYDTSRMTDMSSMFNGCVNLETIPLLDTGSVTNMSNMFDRCSSLTSIPALNTSNVTNMFQMFNGCSSLTSIPQLDTSNVTDMSDMFYQCSKLTSVPQLNTSNVTSMREMFQYCTKLTSIPQLDTSNVTDMYAMFSNCNSLQTIPQLDTSNVTEMWNMFWDCTSLTSVPPINTSNVTSMTQMFYNCYSLTSIPQLDTSKATDIASMFYNCNSLQTIPQLDTSKAINMNSMFGSCEKLQSVDGIDFSSITSKPNSFFGWGLLSSLTRFIVKGSINFSWDDYAFDCTPGLNYESIKSILEAMNRTTNTDQKTMKFNNAIVDREGELAGLVSSCTTKGWTVTGLTIKEQSIINSITPDKEHIVASDIDGMYSPKLYFTVDAREEFTGGGCPAKHTTSSDVNCSFDYYNASTNERVRDGKTVDSPCAVPSGTTGVTEFVFFMSNSEDRPAPQSGEYALVGFTLRSTSEPYEYVDYYFKVYPDGE